MHASSLLAHHCSLAADAGLATKEVATSADACTSATGLVVFVSPLSSRPGYRSMMALGLAASLVMGGLRAGYTTSFNGRLSTEEPTVGGALLFE